MCIMERDAPVGEDDAQRNTPWYGVDVASWW